MRKEIMRITSIICAVVFLIPVIVFNNRTIASAYEKETIEYDIATAFDNLSGYIDISKYNISFSQAFEAFKKVLYENPQYFYVERYIYGNSRGFEINYRYTESEIAIMQAEIEAEAANILSHITNDMTDAQKVCVVHDYMVLTYDYKLFDDPDELEDDDYSLYGIMVNKKGVCQAYAETFVYIMNQLGINSKIVEGYGNGGNHAWNCVEIDGQWYQLDITWDDPIVMYTDYFIVHDYFLISDYSMSDNHIWVYDDYPESPSDYADLSDLIFSYDNGIKYSFDGSILYDYPSNLTDSYFELSDKVYVIADSPYSLYRNYYVTDIYIPSSVLHISSSAFMDFANLKTIHGVLGTAAQEFALDNGYAFVEYIPEVLLGDVDGNGVINTADALIILQSCSEMIILDEFQFSAADMNGDGEITVYDAYMILTAAVSY